MDGDLDSWLVLLPRFYSSSIAKPPLTASNVATILPIAHKYDIGCILDECIEMLNELKFSHEASSPCYLFTWLSLADRLQLDDLREMCMCKFRDMANSQQLEAAMIAPRSKPPAPTKCPDGICTAASAGGACVCAVWCDSCNRWVCNRSSHHVSVHRGRHSYGYGMKSIWFQNDRPRLSSAIEAMSRDTVNDMLASLVVTSNGNYSNTDRF